MYEAVQHTNCVFVVIAVDWIHSFSVLCCQWWPKRVSRRLKYFVCVSLPHFSSGDIPRRQVYHLFLSTIVGIKLLEMYSFAFSIKSSKNLRYFTLGSGEPKSNNFSSSHRLLPCAWPCDACLAFLYPLFDYSQNQWGMCVYLCNAPSTFIYQTIVGRERENYLHIFQCFEDDHRSTCVDWINLFRSEQNKA